jgi:hypothetical protein
MRGKMKAPPEEKPVMQMDMARDRRRTNHLFTALSKVCPRPALFPVETIPKKMRRKTQ